MDPEGGRVKRTGCCKLTGSGAVEPQPEVQVRQVYPQSKAVQLGPERWVINFPSGLGSWPIRLGSAARTAEAAWESAALDAEILRWLE